MRRPGQVTFWRAAQGDDWQQVIDADTDMLRRLVVRSGRLLPEDLSIIHCPVVLTALMEDELLPDVPGQLPAVVRQIPDARLCLLHGQGHPMMWSHSDQFRAVCDLFLDGRL